MTLLALLWRVCFSVAFLVTLFAYRDDPIVVALCLIGLVLIGVDRDKS